MLFLNDIKIKRPTSIYNNEKVKLKVKKYVLKHLQFINRVFEKLEKANFTIELKLQFCIKSLTIVSYITKAEKKNSTILSRRVLPSTRDPY